MEDETGFTATVMATARGAIGGLLGAISLVSRRGLWGRLFAVSASAQKTLVITVPKPSRAAKVRSIAGLPFIHKRCAYIYEFARGWEV